MRASYQTRIVLYVLALALATGLFVAGGLATWWKRNIVEREARLFQKENVQMAEEFNARLRELNVQLLSYEFSRQKTYRQQFTQDATDLSAWLEGSSHTTLVLENRQILPR